ncbi:MAG: hypothetical protein ACI4EJ_01910 [Bacteroides sp.]
MKNKLSKILALFLLAITLTGCDDSQTAQLTTTGVNATVQQQETLSVESHTQKVSEYNNQTVQYQSKANETHSASTKKNNEQPETEKQYQTKEADESKTESESLKNEISSAASEINTLEPEISQSESKDSSPKTVLSEDTQEKNIDDVTVYITNTGKKYHRSGCSYLSKSKIAISKSSAQAKGYDACSRCNP